MTSSPLPSTLVFLSDLPRLASGSKVRFLGCVTTYSTQSGNLHLQHAHPPRIAGKHAAQEVTAVVNLGLLGATVKGTDTQVGAWMNVIGTVQERITRKGEGSPGKEVRIEAVMLWSAGGIRLGEYEKAVEERKGSEGGSSCR